MKGLARWILRLHLPVVPLTRPIFRFLYAIHVAVRIGVPMILKMLWYDPLFRSQCESVGQGLEMDRLPFLTGHGRIVIGDHVRLSGKSSFGFGNRWKSNPELVIGDYTFVGHDCSLAVADSVRIGRHCLVAGGVSISDNDGHPIDAMARRTQPAPPEAIRPVVIGDDVWIGARSVILKGVTIGDRAIVGCGSVVTKSIPADVVVAGNPARIVKSLAVGPI
jgi:acetyltransferase-like isoleucine patch superfamily enzyme